MSKIISSTDTQVEFNQSDQNFLLWTEPTFWGIVSSPIVQKFKT